MDTGERNFPCMYETDIVILASSFTLIHGYKQLKTALSRASYPS